MYTDNDDMSLIGVKTDGSQMIFANTKNKSIHVVKAGTPTSELDIEKFEKDDDGAIIELFESGEFVPANQDRTIKSGNLMNSTAQTTQEDFENAIKTQVLMFEEEDVEARMEGRSPNYKKLVNFLLDMSFSAPKGDIGPIAYFDILKALARNVPNYEEVIKEVLEEGLLGSWG
jgi:hypothetical protein